MGAAGPERGLALSKPAKLHAKDARERRFPAEEHPFRRSEEELAELERHRKRS
jgi:hypothetical protein